MKNLKLLLIFLLSPLLIYAQWTNQNPVPDGNNLRTVFFVDDNNGWIVGSDGFITHTTNQGIDWIQQNSGTNCYLKNVKFIDQHVGWAVGDSGLILKTTNGGNDWRSQQSRSTENLNCVEFINENIGWVVGNNSTILRTTDGGNTWLPNYNSKSNYPLYSICFINRNTGWAAGGDTYSLNSIGVILKTTDGGLTWIEQKLIEARGFYSIFFVNAYIGWAVGSGGNWDMWKTTDGGNNWLKYDLSAFKSEIKHPLNHESLIDGVGGLRSVYFTDPHTGWIAGGEDEYNRILIGTTDGGVTWNLKCSGGQRPDLCSVFVTRSGKGWAVGDLGNIFCSDDNGITWVQQFSGGTNYSLSGDNIYSMKFIDKNIGWAVGYRENDWYSGSSVILKTTNSGRIWKTQLDNVGDAIKSVFFLDELTGWAAEEGVIYSTNDGGDNWFMSTPGINNITSVFFKDRNTGWITRKTFNIYDNAIFKTSDGGQTWVPVSTQSSSSVFFINTSIGWVVGPNGSILKSVDGGENWTIKTSGTSCDLKSVYFWDLNVGMCVGNSGTILLTKDGGESWNPINININWDLTALTFTNSTSIWITGDNGTIIRTTDLGNSWMSYNNVTGNNLRSVCFLNDQIGWIGGKQGTIFKYYSDVLPVELSSFTVEANENNIKLSWTTATEVNNAGFDIERSVDGSKWVKEGFIAGSGNSVSPKSYSFIDNNPVGGTKLSYRLKQIDKNGSYTYSNEVAVDFHPNKFELCQNYPNPFNPTTKIKYHIYKESRVEIKVYNILGSEVMTLINENKEPGTYEVELNAGNLSSGTYIYRIIAGDFVDAKKMILLK